MGSLINAVVLISGSIVILTKAIPRLLSPESTNSSEMIGLAIIGVIVNGVAVYKLSSGKNENVKVLSWHLLEDVLGWAAVLVGAVIIHFTDLYIIDPILSIGMTAFIILNVFKRFSSTVSIFLQSSPLDIDMEQLKSEILAIQGVKSKHHTHAWSLDGEHNVFTTHVIINPDSNDEKRKEIKKALKGLASKLGFTHVTVEIEEENTDCSMDRN